MIIEITGVNRWNKGAELMMRAIKERFIKHPHVKLAVDQRFGSFDDRAQYGLLYRLEINKLGRSKFALKMMPGSMKESVGIVQSDEVDAILDASGFAFGDQHPADRTERFADRVKYFRSKGKPVILLPQALGPFENPRTRDAFSRVVVHADHIFARDPVSLKYALACNEGANHISLAPDFTNLIEIPYSKSRPSTGKACIVPNQRMIEKAKSSEQAESYIPMLCKCIEYLKQKGIECFLLIHGSHDSELIKPIQDHMGYELDVVQETDPVEIKRVLGESFIVIGSRFHALVSALSQAVPSIATSWSHKYEMLFNDYECPELVLPVDATLSAIEAALEIVSGDQRDILIKKLAKASSSLKKESSEMWNKVDEMLGLPFTP